MRCKTRSSSNARQLILAASAAWGRGSWMKFGMERSDPVSWTQNEREHAALLPQSPNSSQQTRQWVSKPREIWCTKHDSNPWLHTKHLYRYFSILKKNIVYSEILLGLIFRTEVQVRSGNIWGNSGAVHPHPMPWFHLLHTRDDKDYPPCQH